MASDVENVFPSWRSHDRYKYKCKFFIVSYPSNVCSALCVIKTDYSSTLWLGLHGKYAKIKQKWAGNKDDKSKIKREWLRHRWPQVLSKYSQSHRPGKLHYSDVIMGTIASQITSLMIVYSTVYSDTDQRKHQSSASLAFVRGIHRGPVNSPHKCPVTRKCFHLMTSSWRYLAMHELDHNILIQIVFCVTDFWKFRKKITWHMTFIPGVTIKPLHLTGT